MKSSDVDYNLRRAYPLPRQDEMGGSFLSASGKRSAEDVATLNRSLAEMGVSVDPVTGEVRLPRRD